MPPAHSQKKKKKKNSLKVASLVLLLSKPSRGPCGGGFCLSTLALGPEMKEASCVGKTWNHSKILSKMAAKYLSGLTNMGQRHERGKKMAISKRSSRKFTQQEWRGVP